MRGRLDDASMRAEQEESEQAAVFGDDERRHFLALLVDRLVIFIVASKDGIGLSQCLVHLGVLNHYIQVYPVFKLL